MCSASSYEKAAVDPNFLFNSRATKTTKLTERMHIEWSPMPLTKKLWELETDTYDEYYAKRNDCGRMNKHRRLPALTVCRLRFVCESFHDRSALNSSLLSLYLSLLLIRASLSSRSFELWDQFYFFTKTKKIVTDFCCQSKFWRSQFDKCQFIHFLHSATILQLYDSQRLCCLEESSWYAQVTVTIDRRMVKLWHLTANAGKRVTADVPMFTELLADSWCFLLISRSLWKKCATLNQYCDTRRTDHPASERFDSNERRTLLFSPKAGLSGFK